MYLSIKNFTLFFFTDFIILQFAIARYKKALLVPARQRSLYHAYNIESKPLFYGSIRLITRYSVYTKMQNSIFIKILTCFTLI